MASALRNPGMERVAVVTGGARGIGAATVSTLVEAGYFVVAVDDCGRRPYRTIGHSVPPPTVREFENQVNGLGGRACAVVGDVADPESLDQLFESVLREHGRVDVVVAAAAIIDGGESLWECPPEMVRELIEVDVLGVWNTVSAAIPRLLLTADPLASRVIVVTSAAASRGLYHLAAYVMAKHAVLGIMRAAAADLSGTGIVTLAVSPGSTSTGMLHATAEVYEAPVEDLTAHQSLGRVIEPSEVAEAIRFACSPAGASLIGSVLTMEGGFD